MSAPSKIRRKRRWPYVLLSLALIFIVGGVWAWFALDVGPPWSMMKMEPWSPLCTALKTA